ncbi:hypothetical protein K0M31_006323 [Melipona bicolor]|uniref:Uncharacterized protein n=1 Tax=Melipona bicolor TaxID=60889 RepID=A0AA40FU19_9HYME|nr:hypothetical protein K0M31_006323 [Melipona bicolor]
MTQSRGSIDSTAILQTRHTRRSGSLFQRDTARDLPEETLEAFGETLETKPGCCSGEQVGCCTPVGVIKAKEEPERVPDLQGAEHSYSSQ